MRDSWRSLYSRSVFRVKSPGLSSMSLWHSGQRSIRLPTSLMSAGRGPSRPRGPATLKATIWAICAKLPSVRVTWCSSRYLLQPSNSQRPPARTKSRSRVRDDMRRVSTITTGGSSLGCTRRAVLLVCLRAFRLCMLVVTMLYNSFSVSRRCVQISQKILECQLPIICLWIILLQSNPGDGAIHVKYAGQCILGLGALGTIQRFSAERSTIYEEGEQG